MESELVSEAIGLYTGDEGFDKGMDTSRISFGSTCQGRRIIIDGQTFFMKELLADFIDIQAYRHAFRKEYEVGSRLDSPLLPRYHSIHETDEGLYMLIENIEGETLKERLTRDANYFATGNHLLTFLEQLMQGVAYLHSQHVVHADLQPNNIMLTRIDGSVRIIDLGYCYTDSFQGTQGKTKGFSAPETKVDARSDIYSIGCIIQYIDKHSRHSLPRWIRQIAKRCTYEAPSRRYQNMEELQYALHHKPLYSRRSTYVALLSIMVLAAGFALLSSMSGRDGAPKPPADFTAHNATKDYLIYYHITNEDSLWVEVTGSNGSEIKRGVGITIPPTVHYSGKEYTVTSVRDTAFREDSLQLVTFPPTLRTIGRWAFRDCHSLTTLKLPESLDSIGEGAFTDCTSLKNVSIPEGLKGLKNCAFSGTGIRKIALPNRLTELPQDLFVVCQELEEVQLPNSLVRIARGVFYKCPKLNNVVIPEKVREIGEYAFHDCTALTDLYLYPTTPPKGTAITNVAPTIHVRRECLEAYQKDLYWSDFKLVGDL